MKQLYWNYDACNLVGMRNHKWLSTCYTPFINKYHDLAIRMKALGYVHRELYERS